MITEKWHQDKSDRKNPEEYVGKQYFHPKTGHLYEVTGFSLDSERGLWMLHYSMVDSPTAQLGFVHTIADFTREGRFLEVKT